MSTRKNYRSLTNQERDRFVQALFELKRQGVIDQFARMHAEHFSHGIHGTSHFLAWHREFILRFEAELRTVHADISLPYWDSSVDQSASDPLWNNAFLGQFDIPWRLERVLGADTLPSVEQVRANQSRATYSAFWPELQVDIHNAPHRWVGGVMASAASPGDPVFFLHHAWIDLLWARWQAAHPDELFMASGSGFGVNDPLMGWPDRTPAHVLDHSRLGYRYDTEWGTYEAAPAGAASAGSGLAAVSRIPNSMETWYVAPDGALKHSYWYEGMDKWTADPDPIAPAGAASAQSGLAAVSRIPNSMETWYIAPDGALNGAFWYEGMADWGTYSIAPTGAASAQSGLAAVSRIPNSMETWYIAPDGALNGAFWYEGMADWGTYSIAPTGAASAQSGLAAVSRIPNSMETWYITPDGALKHAFWYEGMDKWAADPDPIAPAGSASPQSGLAAVSRVPNSMETWYIAPDGAINGAFWYEGMADWVTYPVAPAGTASPESGLAAVSRIPAGMEIWFVAPDGALKGASWYEGAPRWSTCDIAPAGAASAQSGLAAVSRIPNSLETWHIAPNNSVKGTFWYGKNPSVL